MLHTKYQGSSSNDFSKELLSSLLGLAVSDKKKDFPVVMLKYEQYRKKERKRLVCDFVYTWSQAGESGAYTPKKRFLPTRLI